MIFDAWYWQRDLRAVAASLTRRGMQRVWREASYARFERDVVIGFYAIRRLIESHCLNKAFGSLRVKVITFPSLGKPLSYVVWPIVQRYFDLSKPTPTTLRAKDACNRVVHSVVFSPWFSPSNRLSGVFFTSDWHAETVTALELGNMVDFFNAAASSRRGGTRIAPTRNRQVF